MALNNGPHPALQLDEMVQKILEYAASGEPWDKSSNLRIVCKQWREMSFKGLCLSTLLPISLLYNDIRGCDNETYFHKHFPKTCPSHIRLSDPRIPIGVSIDQLPLPRDVSFLREYSCYIASVQVITDHVFAQDGDNRVTEHPPFDFKLPNLTRFHVCWGEKQNYKPWDQLVSHILDISNRVGVVAYGYSCKSKRLTDPNTWPIAHPKVTRVSWYRLPTDLKRVVFPGVKQLVEIHLMLKYYNTPVDRSAESVALAEILEHHSLTLQKVYITNAVRFCLKLPRGQLRELHTLETDFPTLLSNDESNPTSLPRMKTLIYDVGYHAEEESDGFKVSHLASSSLESLNMRWRKSSEDWGMTAEEEEIRDKMILDKFKEEHFPVYPELRKLKIRKVSFTFGQALISKVVQCMENLTCLTVHFVQKPPTGSMSKDYTDNIFNTLTGMTLNEIPKDEVLWSDSLKNKRNAITNLKNLKSLEIKANTSSKCGLGRFIFHAAFHQMNKLEVLKFGNTFKVEKELIEKWESTGRRIICIIPSSHAHEYCNCCD